MKNSRLRSISDKTNIQSQIRAIGRSGKYAQAILLATQELDKPNLSPALQMDLLDIRAEALIAQEKIDLAANDASMMGKLAAANRGEQAHSLALKVMALIRISSVKIKTGDVANAIKMSTKALDCANTLKRKDLIAESLLVLGRAQRASKSYQAAIKTTQQAIPLFRELGDLSGEGRSYLSLAWFLIEWKKLDDAQQAAQTALELCQQTGDFFGVGHALNTFYFITTDIAEQISVLRRAKHAFEMSGCVEGQVAMMANLALAYRDVGLYNQSLRLQNQVLEISRKVGTTLDLMLFLANTIELEMELGLLDEVRLHLQEYESLLPKVDNLYHQLYLITHHAHLAFIEGDTAAAIQHQEKALEFNSSHQLDYDLYVLSGLSNYYLAAQNPMAALQATIKATDLHRSQSFARYDSINSQEIWWRHVQALTANQEKEEAKEALDRAFDLLLESISNVQDVGLRRNALNKVTVNRELLQYWLEEGARQKLPKEQLYAYLNIESNIREPFARLTDISQRLNLLKDIPEIQTFLVQEATELSGAERVMLILHDGTEWEVAESILPGGEEPVEVVASIKHHLLTARLARTVQLILPIQHGRSRIIAPLSVQNKVIGYLYADMDSIYGVFDEIDRDMLGMLTNQTAVVLDNAGLAMGVELIYKDHLTGVFNRRYYDEMIQKLLEDATKDGSSISLLHIDADKFKHINDTYGHQIGDLALKIIADCMKNNSRKQDLVCRLGGDEFVMVLVTLSAKAALQRAEKLCEEIRTHTVGNEQEQTALAVSVGVASFPHQAATASNLLELADIALYRAKADGGDCARAFG